MDKIARKEKFSDMAFILSKHGVKCRTDPGLLFYICWGPVPQF